MDGEAGHEGGTPAGSLRRNSLAGMFPFLQKQPSMDTDQSDRHQRRGGKVKPGKQFSRTSSGDVVDTMSPTAGDASPSAAWLAAGHDNSSTPQGWPSGSLAVQTSTPNRGLFSKLLSKKSKHRGSVSPAAPSSPSLGASSNGSQSPTSHSAEQLPGCAMGHLPVTPPSLNQQQRVAAAGRGDVAGDDDADFGSCYSTPIGSEAMQSPSYGGDTLDFRQVMAMRQEMPDVFTPGFNELLQQGGRHTEPDTPQGSMAGEEPTVALLTGTQLAQAGRMYDVAAMLLDPVRESSATPATSARAAASSIGSSPTQPHAAGSQPATAVPEHDHAADQLGHTAASEAAADMQEQKPVSSSDVELSVEEPHSIEQHSEHEQEPQEAVAVAAVAAASCPDSSASSASGSTAPPVPESAAGGDNACSDTASSAHGPAAVAALPGGSADDSEAAPPSTAEQEQAAEGPASMAALEQPVEQQPPSPVEAEMACADDEGVQSPSSAAAASSSELESAQATEAFENDPTEQNTPARPATNIDEAAEQLPNSAATVKVLGVAPKGVAQPDVEKAYAEADSSNALPAEKTAAALLPTTALDDGIDEFAALEQQVAEEVAAEAEYVEFAELEQQAAAEAAAEAEDVEFAELERQTAAATQAAIAGEASSSSLPEVPECSSGSVAPMRVKEEPSLPASEASDGVPLPLPCEEPEPGSPEGHLPAPSKLRGNDSGSPVHMAASAASSARKSSRRSPINLVRESMPLFLADPSRAMGSPLALEPGEDSLDAQDMQQLSGGSRCRAAGTAGGGVGAPRLLSHGAAQRVNIGAGLGGSSFMSSLEPVAESSFNSAGSPSPEPEGSPSFAGSDSEGSSKSNPRCKAAEAGSPGEISPLQPRRLSSSPSRADATGTPAQVGSSPNLAVTSGSVYSTPTLALGASAGYSQGATPQYGVASEIGSAIRPTGVVVGALDLSPAVPDNLPEASPTLMLMPGQGLNSAPQHEAGDGSTPSLLDARAASPSAVYATRFMATPFRGALAALPIDAALAAPLVDSSPFSLRDDYGMDTVCLADEAQRVAQNLAAVAAGSFTPGPAATPAVHIPQSATSPGSAAAAAGGVPERPGSPTEELRDLHVVMLTKQLAEVQKRVKDLEADNERLKEQVEIYEFEKTELNSQEEMEKQARQYAEEQVQHMQVEMQQLMQAKSAQAAQMLSMRQEFEGIQLQAQRQHDAMKQEHAQLAATITQLQEERNDVLDRLNLLDMQVTALRSNNNELLGALEAEQQRSAQLEAALAARDKDIADAGRVQLEAKNKLERAMEQMIAANTAKEHARQKAADEAAKVQQLMTERQQLMAERQQVVAEREKYQHLKQKYAQKSAMLKEVEQRLQGKEAENQELMSMCDQLLQQQEAHLRAA